MGNVLDKSCRENENTFYVQWLLFRKLHRLWDNVEKFSGDQGVTNDITIWRIRVACWFSKAICTYTHANAHAPGYPHARIHAQARTHNQYVILIAFSQQQWFRERTSMLRYTYIVLFHVTPDRTQSSHLALKNQSKSLRKTKKKLCLNIANLYGFYESIAKTISMNRLPLANASMRQFQDLSLLPDCRSASWYKQILRNVYIYMFQLFNHDAFTTSSLFCSLENISQSVC